MKPHFKPALIFLALAFVCSLGCHKTNYERKTLLDGNYQGTFNMPHSPNDAMGSVTLTISNGTYVCNTSLPYNYGAGYIEITESTLFFKDTLFFIVPAVYITGYSLSGKYNYLFDGTHLQVQKSANSGGIVYNLIRQD